MLRAEWDRIQARKAQNLMFPASGMRGLPSAEALRVASQLTEREYGLRPAAPATTGGLPWHWRLTAKAAGAIGGVMFANLKRYLPLLSTLVLVVQTVAALLNKEQIASAAAGLGAIVGQAPAEVVTAVAAVGAAVGLVLKAISVLKTGVVAK
jgi:hypothetical protein